MKIKKGKAQKVCQKTKLKFKNYKNCLQTTQFENIFSRKKEININSLKTIKNS